MNDWFAQWWGIFVATGITVVCLIHTVRWLRSGELASVFGIPALPKWKWKTATIRKRDTPAMFWANVAAYWLFALLVVFVALADRIL